MRGRLSASSSGVAFGVILCSAWVGSQGGAQPLRVRHSARSAGGAGAADGYGSTACTHSSDHGIGTTARFLKSRGVAANAARAAVFLTATRNGLIQQNDVATCPKRTVAGQEGPSSGVAVPRVVFHQPGDTPL